MVAVILLLLAGAAPQVAPASPPPVPAAVPPRTLEISLAHDLVDRQQDWQRVESRLFWTGTPRVRPLFEAGWHRRAHGSQVRGGAGAHVDWSPRLYTVQAVSLATDASAPARAFARQRFDVGVFLKSAPDSPLV